MKLGNHNMCFACGKDNPISLGLNFKFNGCNQVKAEFVPKEFHQNLFHNMHSGLVCTLLDEAMVTVSNIKGKKTVTAEMEVKFKNQVPLGKKVVVTAIVKKEYKKLLYTEAVLENSKKVYATSKGKFMKI